MDAFCSTLVRYLFDAQLFNVPNNFRQYNYLLTYLKHERIFNESLLVYNKHNRIRASYFNRTAADYRWPAGESSGRASDNARRRDRRTLDDCRTDPERCRLLLDRVRAPAASGKPGGNGSGPIAYVLRQSSDQQDFRELMTGVELSGGPSEWLELKYTLNMPSIMLFFKLQGSQTHVPNADHTVCIDMKELRVLQGSKTIGERVAMLVAEVRRRFFNEPLPDFERLAIMRESDVYLSSSSSSSSSSSLDNDEDGPVAGNDKDDDGHGGDGRLRAVDRPRRVRERKPRRDAVGDPHESAEVPGVHGGGADDDAADQISWAEPQLEVLEDPTKRRKRLEARRMREHCQRTRRGFCNGSIERVLVVSDIHDGSY